MESKAEVMRMALKCRLKYVLLDKELKAQDLANLLGVSDGEVSRRAAQTRRCNAKVMQPARKEITKDGTERETAVSKAAFTHVNKAL